MITHTYTQVKKSGEFCNLRFTHTVPKCECIGAGAKAYNIAWEWHGRMESEHGYFGGDGKSSACVTCFEHWLREVVSPGWTYILQDVKGNTIFKLSIEAKETKPIKHKKKNAK